MGKKTWMHWVAAAILVLLAGVVIAWAEERIEVRVESDGGDEVSVDVNGVREVIHLEDLAEGESRTFDVGDHELVVSRVGDDLKVVTEGLGNLPGLEGAENVMLWVGEDGKTIELGGDCEGCEHDVIVMKVDGDVEGGEHVYKIKVDGDEVIDLEKFIEKGGLEGDNAYYYSTGSDGDHPLILKHHLREGMVKYRCEETGATLLLRKEDAVYDSYTCPATGCVMKKVEEPEMKFVTIKKKIEIEEDDD